MNFIFLAGITMIVVTISSLFFSASQNVPLIDNFAKNTEYGCIECHPSSLACHIDWQRSELEKIRTSWNLSFHVKLQKDDFDPFSICILFFRKGDCLYCHPNILTPGAKEKRPKYSRICTSLMPDTVLHQWFPLSVSQNRPDFGTLRQ